MDRFNVLSLTAFLLAIMVAAAGLSGIWTVTGTNTERLSLLLIEALTVLLLIANSHGIRRWVYRHSNDPVARRVAWLCFIGLCLCFGGDIVNFNLPQTYFRHGEVIKHDYLADSVWLFAPGYLLLMVAALYLARSRGLSQKTMIVGLGLGALMGAISFATLHLPGTGTYVSVITGFYSMLITAVGVSGVLLLLSYGLTQAPPMAWLVALGLVLAAVADAVIGSFWLYGNNGQGFFPEVRDINWVIYIGSQSLVIHLPRLAARHD